MSFLRNNMERYQSKRLKYAFKHFTFWESSKILATISGGDLGEHFFQNFGESVNETVVGFHHISHRLPLSINCERVAKRENEVGELALLQPCNQPLEGVLGKLTSVFFEDGLHGLG